MADDLRLPMMGQVSEFAPRPRPRPQIDLTEIEQAVLKDAGYVAAAPEGPTDVQYVANNLDRLRYLDLKTAVTGMLGTEMPKDINEAIDRVAEWAAANKTGVAA